MIWKPSRLTMKPQKHPSRSATVLLHTEASRDGETDDPGAQGYCLGSFTGNQAPPVHPCWMNIPQTWINLIPWPPTVGIEEEFEMEGAFTLQLLSPREEAKCQQREKEEKETQCCLWFPKELERIRNVFILCFDRTRVLIVPNLEQHVLFPTLPYALPSPILHNEPLFAQHFFTSLPNSLCQVSAHCV